MNKRVEVPKNGVCYFCILTNSQCQCACEREAIQIELSPATAPTREELIEALRLAVQEPRKVGSVAAVCDVLFRCKEGEG